MEVRHIKEKKKIVIFQYLKEKFFGMYIYIYIKRKSNPFFQEWLNAELLKLDNVDEGGSSLSDPNVVPKLYLYY